MKKVAVLGSTGSVGQQTLAVIDKLEGFAVHSLSAHSNISLFGEQIKKYNPSYACLTGSDTPPPGVHSGEQSIMEACEGADIVLLAIMGIAALPAFEYCLKHQIPIALANKEAMVCAGSISQDLMKSCTIIPVDSELSAILQCLRGNSRRELKRILLTASGGPFRLATAEQLECVTPEMALKHPNWKMGAKITVDCATMMNKGLEIIETRWLFDVPQEQIDVVVHPESIVHSMVEFRDNCIMAQLAVPDMSLPIAHALTYDTREQAVVPPLDLFGLKTLSFFPPDYDKFPCLALARAALNEGGATPLVLNSANECAVSHFLEGTLSFTGIAKLVECAMSKFCSTSLSSFSQIHEIDVEVRKFCSTVKRFD